MTPRTTARLAHSKTFAALAIPNYRRYTIGQAISLVGTWMQTLAQSYLVFALTRSGTDVGLVVAVQTLPVLLLGPYAGVIADRVDKRRLMVVLQSLMSVQALALGLLTITHRETLTEIFVLAFVLGLNNTFENPARQTFVLEMVGPRDLRNAVTLNSVMINAARAVGPAFAGILITTVGTGVCFLTNSATFIAVVYSLMSMDTASLQPSPPSGRAKGQLREGLTYVRRTPDLLIPLLMMALVGCLAYEFQVTLPVYAVTTLHGDASTYGFITAAMGVGAVVGGLWTAGRGKTGMRAMVLTATFFAVVIALAAVAPDLWLALIAMLLVGAGSVGFLSIGNSTLQLRAAPTMRGRVMSLWAVAFLGSTPIGGPLAGFVAQHLGGRAGLALGAIACAVAAVAGVVVMRRMPPASDDRADGQSVGGSLTEAAEAELTVSGRR